MTWSEQAKDNLAATGWSLTAEQTERLTAASTPDTGALPVRRAAPLVPTLSEQEVVDQPALYRGRPPASRSTGPTWVSWSGGR